MSESESGTREDSSRAIVDRALEGYAERVAGAPRPWWDLIAITARDGLQAEHYRDRIRLRLAQGRVPNRGEWLVVPDAEGERVGSGGATLGALRAIEVELGAAASRSRVLLIHAGGESRRLPAYAGVGKL